MNGKAAIFSEDGGLISHRRCRLNIVFAKGGVEYIKPPLDSFSRSCFSYCFFL